MIVTCGLDNCLAIPIADRDQFINPDTLQISRLNTAIFFQILQDIQAVIEKFGNRTVGGGLADPPFISIVTECVA